MLGISKKNIHVRQWTFFIYPKRCYQFRRWLTCLIVGVGRARKLKLFGRIDAR
jgi:hypothetical protein